MKTSSTSSAACSTASLRTTSSVFSVGTHVTTRDRRSAARAETARRRRAASRRSSRTRGRCRSDPADAESHATAAGVGGATLRVRRGAVPHVLQTFPLVPRERTRRSHGGVLRYSRCDRTIGVHSSVGPIEGVANESSRGPGARLGDLASDRVRRCADRGLGARRRTAAPSARARPAARRLDGAAGARRNRDPATSRRSGSGSRCRNRRTTRRSTEVDQLQTQNAMLDIIARSVDVPLAFQALAARVARLVPCDRVGLALLSEDGRSSRPTPPACNRRSAARGRVRRSSSRSSARSSARRFTRASRCSFPTPQSRGAGLRRRQHPADIRVQVGAARAARLRGRAVGTLNVVSRQRGGTSLSSTRCALADCRDPGRRLGGAAAAHDPRQAPDDGGDVRADAGGRGRDQQRAADDHRPLRPARARRRPTRRSQRDLRTITGQAQRIAGLLDKMRSAAHQRLRR